MFLGFHNLSKFTLCPTKKHWTWPKFCMYLKESKENIFKLFSSSFIRNCIIFRTTSVRLVFSVLNWQKHYDSPFNIELIEDRYILVDGVGGRSFECLIFTLYLSSWQSANSLVRFSGFISCFETSIFYNTNKSVRGIFFRPSLCISQMFSIQMQNSKNIYNTEIKFQL